MGVFATIGRGWKMSKLSMSVVKKDPELMVYMFISGFLSLIAMIGMSVPQYLKQTWACLLYTSPSPRDVEESRMPSSA